MKKLILFAVLCIMAMAIKAQTINITNTTCVRLDATFEAIYVDPTTQMCASVSYGPVTISSGAVFTFGISVPTSIVVGATTYDLKSYKATFTDRCSNTYGPIWTQPNGSGPFPICAIPMTTPGYWNTGSPYTCAPVCTSSIAMAFSNGTSSLDWNLLIS